MGDRVEVVGPYGERGSVDKADLPAVLAQKGRVLTPEEQKQETYGGTGGAVGAALVGAANTLTLGGFNAVGSDIAKANGDQASFEEAIKSLKETNPIAHALGTAAPLVLAPEFGGEELAANAIGGGGRLAEAAQFALPQFARGAAETAWVEGAQGISEDVLDHDLAAESFYVHAMKPETFYGGLLNLGVATGFKGLGKVAGKLVGRVGKVTSEDAGRIDDIVQAVQESGGTSQDASAAIQKVQSLANERANLPAEARAAMDTPAEAYIKLQSKGDPSVARQLTRHYRDGKKVLEAIDDELTAHAKVADEHMTSLINDMTVLEDARLNLKHKAVKDAADASTIVQAHDAANEWLQELRATLSPPALPPEPSLGDHLVRVLRDSRKQGVILEEGQAQALAKASHAQEMGAWQEEAQRLMAERESKVDPKIRELFGDPGTRVGFSAKDHSKLMSLLGDVQREVNAGRRVGGQEGVARIYTALDDSRSILGHMAKFGRLTSDSAKMLERYVYNNRLKPLLEDSNVWGSRLADLQSSNNEAVTRSIKAIGAVKDHFFGVLDNDAGRPIYTPKGNTKRFIESLGEGDGPGFLEEAVRRVTDSARARGAAMLRTMDMPAEVRAAIERSQQSATKLEKVLDAARDTAVDAREIRGLKAREGFHGMHGILGTIATGVANIALNPTRTLEWMGSFRKATEGVRNLFDKESKSFLKGESVPVVKPMLGEAERKAAIQSIADVNRYRSEPSALALAVRDTLGDMVHAAPQVATSLATTIARGVLALSKRAPVPLPPRFTDKPGEVRYANGDLEKYWRNKQLIESPMVTWQLMRSGQLHQEDIQLMQEFMPRLFTQMQTQLESDLIKARQKGELRSMTYQEQIGVSWMLGRPLDASQSPQFTMAMQQSAAQDPMNQAAFGKSAMCGGRPSRLENINLERYSTLEERLEG